MQLASKLVELIRACFTGIWIESHEHEDALAEVAQRTLACRLVARRRPLTGAVSSTESGVGSGSRLAPTMLAPCPGICLIPASHFEAVLRNRRVLPRTLRAS